MSEGETIDGDLVESQIANAQPMTGPTPADLARTAADPKLTEDSALALLKRTDLPPEVLEQLARNATALKSRKVKVALVRHAHTPRHVSVPMARQFYTFDLMKVALSLSVPADIKVAIDNVLISRLTAVTMGERLTLARRASGRVAAALLTDVAAVEGKAADRETAGNEPKNAESTNRETRVMRTALENPRLTEALVIKAVLRADASEALVAAIAQHKKWSVRREIRAALLRTEHLSLARALEFSREIPAGLLQQVLASSHLPGKIKEQLRRQGESLHNL
jgi:hypothetical protein